MKVRIAILFTAFLVSSCIGTKYLKPGEKILYKQKIESDGRLNEEKVSAQFAQKTNTKFLFFFHTQVYIYHVGLNNLDTGKVLSKRDKIKKKFDRKIGKTKKEKKQNRLALKKNQKLDKLDKKLKEGNLFMRWGETLVIYDSTKIPQSNSNIKNYLFSIGYFDAEVSSETVKSNDKINVSYNIQRKDPYKIDSLIFVVKDSVMGDLFEKNKNKIDLAGNQYSQDLLTAERERVYELMSNNGYYNFKRQYILFEVDSTILDDNLLVVRETLVNPPGKTSHTKFRLDSIIFNNESTISRTRKPRFENYEDVTYDLTTDKYSPKLLDWRIFLHKDSLYSKEATLETQRQLSYLDMFKFVNINFDSTGSKFVANLFTSPLKKYQTSTEVGLSVFDQANGLPGPFINFNAKSRNTFGGFEIIQFDGNASIQGISSVSAEDYTYSRLQYGGQVSVTFPQFLFPLKKSQRERIGRYNPRTKFASGINFEDRRDEYERNTFNTSMSYIWQVKNNLQFTLKPFDVSYIFSDTFGQFENDLDSIRNNGGKSLVTAFESSLVSFSSFEMNLNINNYGTNTNATFFKTYLELGYNAKPLAEKIVSEPDSLAYYEYLKVNLDYRQSKRLTRKSSLAYRFNLGVSYLFGDEKSLPYEKYFFAGGSNSIRAWQPRRLGPGAYGVYETSGNVNYREGRTTINRNREQPGDIILETSIEFRHDLIGFVDYAFFLDAGNVWLWKSNTLAANNDPQMDDGVFHFNSFANQIALGGGFGLRFDFSFLILRFDLAYKMVDPAYPVGDRFRIPHFRIKDLIDLNNASNFVVGIGYPF